MSKLKYKTAFTFEVDFNGYDLEVHGNFIPGEDDTLSTPGCSDRFDIDNVKMIDSNEPVPDDVDMDALEEFILDKKFD